MTWTRLSDDYADRPALLSVSRSARLLDVEGLLYCNRHGTDGYLPAAALPRITDADDSKADVAELVKAEIWTETDTGWQLDWSDQESARRVKERREYTASRNRAYRERGELHQRGDHSQCTDRCPHASKDALRDASRAATRPVPSRPKDKGQGPGRLPDAADASPAAPQEEGTSSHHSFAPDDSGVTCTVCGTGATNRRHNILLGGAA